MASSNKTRGGQDKLTLRLEQERRQELERKQELERRQEQERRQEIRSKKKLIGSKKKKGHHDEGKGAEKSGRTLETQPSMTEISIAVDGGGEDGGRDKMRTASITGSQDYSLGSYNHEMVAIDDEGHPYIDINKLIFRPKSDDKHIAIAGYQPEKLRCSDYAPDFAFIVFNLITVGISIYFIIMSYSTLEWQGSMRMFSIPNCHALVLSSKSDGSGGVQASTNRKLENFFYLPCVEILNSESFKGKTEKYDFTRPVAFPVFRTWLAQPDSLAVVLIVTEMVNLLNVIIGISACLKGYKAILIQHIIVNGIGIGMELIISILITVTGNCDKDDLGAARLLLTHYVRWYGVTISTPSKQSDKERQLNAQVDALQIGLNCCGMDGWADYLPAGYPNYFRPLENAHLDGEAAIIPYSCCRRWWIRNIYCAQGAHLLADPSATVKESNRFHERIVQDGCLYKLEKFCDTMVLFNGFYAVLIVMFHLTLTGGRVFAAFKLIRNIDKMIENQKKEMKRKELMHDPGDGSEVDVSLKGRKEGGGVFSQLPPPTEDEISTIKDRSNFNKFTAAMKHGKVEQWMEKARQRVTKGQEDQEPEAQTAMEKRAREKELLHGKAKKGYQAELEEIKAELQVEPARKSVGFMASKLDYLKVRAKAHAVAHSEGGTFPDLTAKKHARVTSPKPKKKKRIKRKKKGSKQGKKKSLTEVPTSTEVQTSTEETTEVERAQTQTEEEEPKPRKSRRRRRRKKKKLPEKKPWWTWF